MLLMRLVGQTEAIGTPMRERCGIRGAGEDCMFGAGDFCSTSRQNRDEQITAYSWSK